MKVDALDLMVEQAAEALLNGDPVQRRRLVGALARSYPRQKALMVSLALSGAAAQIEDTFRDGSMEEAAARGYKLAAVVAADVLAIEALGREPAMAGDLLLFWRRVDPRFLGG